MSRGLKVTLGRNRLFLQARGRSIEVPVATDPGDLGQFTDDPAELAALRRGLDLAAKFHEIERAGGVPALTRCHPAALN